jgi:hypothetical protein
MTYSGMREETVQEFTARSDTKIGPMCDIEGLVCDTWGLKLARLRETSVVTTLRANFGSERHGVASHLILRVGRALFAPLQSASRPGNRASGVRFPLSRFSQRIIELRYSCVQGFAGAAANALLALIRSHP